MTLDAFLRFEESSRARHEYVAGEVYAMSGVTTSHNLIALNIATHLRGPAALRKCRVFASDVKLKAGDRVYYPDVMLACGKAAIVDQVVEEPSLLVEVTSNSTRATDRREKLEAYRRIPSLGVYLIVDQRRRHVLAYVRGTNGEWSKFECAGADEDALPASGVPLTMDQIYESIDLPPLAVGEEVAWDEYGSEDDIIFR